MKRCARCRLEKPHEDFYSRAERLDAYCKPCRKQKTREWIAANPERDREIKRASRKKWNAEHPEELRALRKRYKRKHKPARRVRVYRREGGICHICRKPVSVEEFHVEHLWPHAAGGSDHMSNLAIAHPACNLLKADSLSEVQLRLA